MFERLGQKLIENVKKSIRYAKEEHDAFASHILCRKGAKYCIERNTFSSDLPAGGTDSDTAVRSKAKIPSPPYFMPQIN